MKKLAAFFSIVMILALMAGLLPTGSAFAKKDPGTINLNIHNRTGKLVNFELVGPDGVHKQYVLPTGLTVMSLSQGWYDYFASLPCGNRSGEFNLNVSKELYLTCGVGAGVDIYNFARRYTAPVCVYEFTAPIQAAGGSAIARLPIDFVPCCPPLGRGINGSNEFIFTCFPN